ncbi:hypothetical protein, partial [Mesorhizobium sp. M7A.F.Ca.CA.004.09.1.2]|uniref:hypothetical protein n=1 Tax=Mesorhizobium sp. M7A.F.Ca.CA.004.09.1.2 TaxID=2496695 RepID=UPI0019CFC040
RPTRPSSPAAAASTDDFHERMGWPWRQPILLYSRRRPAYVSRRPTSANRTEQPAMRAETQNIVDEIRQAITLLRRHL